MRRLGLIALALLTACGSGANESHQLAKGTEGGPPPPPPYQMRAELPAGDRLVPGKNGEDLFSNRCGSCHLAGGMGTNLLTVQRMKAGEPPETGLLTNRTDLTADYIKTVVRDGKMAMPRISRVEATDAELDAIAQYLAKADQ
jgi:mono/diheme cytochrome c family protein